MKRVTKDCLSDTLFQAALPSWDLRIEGVILYHFLVLFWELVPTAVDMYNLTRRPPVERKLVSVKTLFLVRVVKQEPLARSETSVVKTDDLTSFLFVAADEVVDIVVVAFELSHNFIILVKQEGEALYLPLFQIFHAAELGRKSCSRITSSTSSSGSQ